MKKLLAYIVVFVVLGIIGSLGAAIYGKYLEAEEVRVRILKLADFEVIPIIKPDTIQDSQRPVIIGYFSSKCQFCQVEIQSIIDHEKLSKEARVLLISNERRRVIEVFAKSFGLDTAMVEVAWDSSGMARTFLGVKGVPATFVYGADSLLIEQFKGETKAKVLYEMIN